MKKALQDYITYHIWANTRIVDCIRKLSEEQIYQEVTSSFPGIYNTVLHMWNAERAWWLRLQQEPNIVSATDWFKGDFNELVENLQQQSQLWKDWISSTTDEALQQSFNYKTYNGDPYTQPIQEVVFHFINHATYHRGQLVTILRQLGVTTIPSTDMIVFYRAVGKS